MLMERHKCKLCFRVFPNGRCLGGHMKSHLAKIHLPPKSSSAITCRRRRRPDDNESFSSFSYSSSREEEDEQEIIKSRAVAEFGGFGSDCDEAVYGLKENPRKRFRVADPEFSFAGSSSVVQDRESETESRNPTRRRSKRTRHSVGDQNKGLTENPRWIFDSPVAGAEQEPVISVSNTSPEEDVAMWLVMLSRDVNWKRRFSYNRGEIEEGEEVETENGGEIKKWAEIEEDDQGIMERSSKIQGKKLKCEKCMKQFRSSRALGPHRRISSGGMGNVVAERIFHCIYCCKVFGSGQALGGHKRSHLTGGGSYPSLHPPPPPPPAAKIHRKKYSFLDLNFPAPAEDDEFSVVSDA